MKVHVKLNHKFVEPLRQLSSVNKKQTSVYPIMSKNDEIKAIFSELECFLYMISLDSISKIDPSSLFVLESVVENIKQHKYITDGDLFMLQALLDRNNEWLNIGHWKDVEIHLRYATTIISFLLLLGHFGKNDDDLNNVFAKAFKSIDRGLLFGCPLPDKSDLLQECAAVLNKYRWKNYNLAKSQNHHFEQTEVNIINTTTSIPILECPSLEYFNQNLLQKQEPAVLTKCIDHWPALKMWKDKQYLLQKAGLRTVPVEVGSRYTDANWTQSLMTLEEFIEKHIDQSDIAKDTGYLAQHQLFNQIPELLNDIVEPDYCCLSSNENGTDINAWFGPKGTVSPLHFDPKNNLLAQIIGEKRIILFNPADTPYLYPLEDSIMSNTSQVDPKEPNLQEYPEFAKATPFTCSLRAGDMLFIPQKWWHYVESYSVSFSVSFWWM